MSLRYFSVHQRKYLKVPNESSADGLCLAFMLTYHPCPCSQLWYLDVETNQGAVLFLCTECSCWVVLITVASLNLQFRLNFHPFHLLNIVLFFTDVLCMQSTTSPFPFLAAVHSWLVTDLSLCGGIWVNLLCLRFCLLCLCQVIWEAAGVLSLAIYMVSLKFFILNSLPSGKANLTNQWLG